MWQRRHLIGIIKDLKHSDIRIAKSLSRVLKILDLTEDDLLLLKDIKKLEEENADLRARIDVLENQIENMNKIKLTQEMKEFLAQTEGETLRNG